MPVAQAKYTRGSNGFLDRECPVCMEPFLKGQHIMSCKHDNRHMFHTFCNRGECVCPVCRSTHGFARNHLAEEICATQPDLQDGPFFSYAPGKDYRGQWKDNVPHGSGTMKTVDGTIHVGQFANGVANGKGTRTYSDGLCYEGEFVNGKGASPGKIHYISGDVYDGELKDTYRHGHGTMKWPSGHMYTGEWVFGKRTGQGTMKWPSGAMYITFEGQWRDDAQNGHGTMKWPSGHVYTGEWMFGKRTGQGKKTWPDGREYNGSWRFDQENGMGTVSMPDGTTFTGTWVDGCLVGEVTKARDISADKAHQLIKVAQKRRRSHPTGDGAVKWHSGNVYEGEMKEHNRHGHGTMKWHSGQVYTGEWMFGKRTGQGKKTWPDGRVYNGSWRFDQENGMGTLSMPDGTTFTGTWVDGCLKGEVTKARVISADKAHQLIKVAQKRRRSHPTEDGAAQGFTPVKTPMCGERVREDCGAVCLWVELPDDTIALTVKLTRWGTCHGVGTRDHLNMLCRKEGGMCVCRVALHSFLVGMSFQTEPN